ncbi:MAG: arabinan endo-1,5-alpha-L-arabinosidase, partial [Lachnospiraceae bacterium]|nr:arabinan endo-1,5-alpha-L-arabinosidase [Lachnospiraceae bacterium]
TYAIEEGTSYIDLKIGDVEFSGVLVDMPDEAGNPTRCFTAVGSNNHSLWGVMYLEGEQ